MPTAGKEQGTKEEVWAGEQGERALNAHARGSLKPPVLRFPRFPLLEPARIAFADWLACSVFCSSSLVCMAMDAPAFSPARAVKIPQGEGPKSPLMDGMTRCAFCSGRN